METEKTVTQRIMAVTLEIQENYPELTKYMAEMTVTSPDEKNPDVNRKKLLEYYDSLIAMVKKYKEGQLHLEDERNRP